MLSLNLLGALVPFAALASAQSCVTESQPNPIPNASYPITGTVNGTIAILPISYDLARSIIPSEYGILTKQYRQWLPWLPHDQYPAMLQTELDHDIYFGGAPGGPDFARAGISFPFVDRLNDGYSAFAYNNHILITANATGVIPAFEQYGYVVTGATFEPACDAYAYVGSRSYGNGGEQEVYFKALPQHTLTPGIAWDMDPVRHSPYSLDL